MAQRMWTFGSKTAVDRSKAINRRRLFVVFASVHHLQIKRATGQWGQNNISPEYFQRAGKLQHHVSIIFNLIEYWCVTFRWKKWIFRVFRRYETEPKVAVIWGLLITCGSKLLESNANAKDPLLKMARYLQSISNPTDGWGEGLLGAIGLKRETISTKYGLIDVGTIELSDWFRFSLF